MTRIFLLLRAPRQQRNLLFNAALKCIIQNRRRAFSLFSPSLFRFFVDVDIEKFASAKTEETERVQRVKWREEVAEKKNEISPPYPLPLAKIKYRKKPRATLDEITIKTRGGLYYVCVCTYLYGIPRNAR